MYLFTGYSPGFYAGSDVDMEQLYLSVMHDGDGQTQKRGQ